MHFSECRDSVNLESKPLDISDISDIYHPQEDSWAAKMGGDMLDAMGQRVKAI